MSSSEPLVAVELRDAPIFHVHPSLRCNLSCEHCYSASSPRERDRLGVPELVAAIEDAAEIGFKVLSVSGGEPFLFAGLEALLETARHCGMKTQVVTNGWFLTTKRFLAVAGLIDGIAVSLDGLENRHNLMRGSPLAFRKLETGLAALRDRSIKFGIVHTVTQDNWDELFDVARFCLEVGASSLQIHSLEQSGRADSALRPSDEIAAKVFIISSVLKSWHAGRLNVHVDLQHRSSFALCDGTDPLLAMGILVLEADGTLVPMSYGFARTFALGNLKTAPLAVVWQHFVGSGFPRLLSLRDAVADSLKASNAPIAFNWFEEMNRASHSVPLIDCIHRAAVGAMFRPDGQTKDVGVTL